MASQEPKDVSTIAAVQALVGRELGVSPWLTVTQEQVNTFADLTSDHQYIHVDTRAGAPDHVRRNHRARLLHALAWSRG